MHVAYNLLGIVISFQMQDYGKCSPDIYCERLVFMYIASR